MFILKKGHQPGVYVPLRALFLVFHPLFLLLVNWSHFDEKCMKHVYHNAC